MHIDTKIRLHICVYAFAQMYIDASLCLSVCLSVCLCTCPLVILLSVSHDAHSIESSHKSAMFLVLLSHATHIQKSCHVYDWVMLHIRLGCHADDRVMGGVYSTSNQSWIMAHIWMSHITPKIVSWYADECVMSRVWLSHVTTWGPQMLYSTSDMKWVMAHMDDSWHTWMNHVTHMKESWHAPE